MAYRNGGSSVSEPIFNNLPSNQNTTPQPQGGGGSAGGGGLFGSLRESVGKFFSGGSSNNGGVWAQGGQVQPNFSPGTQQPIHCAIARGVGLTQCPPDHDVADPVLEAMGQGSLAGLLVLLIAGWDRSTRRVSRPRWSAQISGDLELGWAHAATVGKSWMGRDVIRELARQLPELSATAWGADFANRLKTDAFSNEVIDLFLNQKALPEDPRAMLLIQGWNALSKTAPGQRVYASEWFRSKVYPMRREMEERGWTKIKTLAALTRLRNSGRQHMILNRTSLGEEAAVEAGLKDYAAERSSRKDDVERIRNWPEFKGDITAWPKWQDLNFQGATTVATPPPEPGQTTPPNTPSQPTSPYPEPRFPSSPQPTTPSAPNHQGNGGGRVAPGVDASGRIQEEGRFGTFVLGGLAVLILGTAVAVASKVTS